MTYKILTACSSPVVRKCAAQSLRAARHSTRGLGFSVLETIGNAAMIAASLAESDRSAGDFESFRNYRAASIALNS